MKSEAYDTEVAFQFSSRPFTPPVPSCIPNCIQILPYRFPLAFQITLSKLKSHMKFQIQIILDHFFHLNI